MRQNIHMFIYIELQVSVCSYGEFNAIMKLDTLAQRLCKGLSTKLISESFWGVSRL